MIAAYALTLADVLLIVLVVVLILLVARRL